MDFETLITIPTIENLNSRQSLWPVTFPWSYLPPLSQKFAQSCRCYIQFQYFCNVPRGYHRKCQWRGQQGSGIRQGGVAPGRAFIWEYIWFALGKLLCCAQHMLISHHSILHLQYIGWLSKSLHLSNSQHRLTTITGQYWARNWRYYSLRSVHASSGSEWSSSWKYRARRRGSYSTMGTISSWPASFLPEIPALLQYWIGATSSASQSWKRISVGKVKITDRSKPSQCCRFQWCWTLWGGREQRAPGCVTPDSSHPGEKGWWRNFLRDFFFCIQHLLETWQEVVTLQGPKPPPNINTGKWYTWALDDGKNMSVKDNGPNWVGYLA